MSSARGQTAADPRPAASGMLASARTVTVARGREAPDGNDQAGRLLARGIVVLVVVLVGWTIYLALALPGNHDARHWDLAWVGFDTALIVVLGVTAWAAWFRRQILVAAALVTGPTCHASPLDTVPSWHSPTTGVATSTTQR